MIIPIYDIVLLPGMTYSLNIKPISKQQLDKSIASAESIIALPLKQKVKGLPNSEDFYKIGVTLSIRKIEDADSSVHVTFGVENFAEVTNIIAEGNIIKGETKTIVEYVDIDATEQAEMLEYIKKHIRETTENIHFKGIEELVETIMAFDTLNELMGFTSQGMQLTTSEKYRLMETISLKKRALLFIELIMKFNEKLKLQVELAEHFSERTNKNYREAVLREQLRLIQEELNDSSSEEKSGNDDYRKRVEEAHLPKVVEKAVLEEIDKLEAMNPASSDYNVSRNYIDFILELPWYSNELEDISINEARRVLNEHHYGLKKVKDRIIQHLAVMQLRKDKKGSIILLVGPPGTGKTSLGKSIAEALGRQYVRISLGGVRDEAQIRGHRRTYVGALPGRILKSMKDAGTMNPVMVLDEVDKLMVGFSGDPASALLEVLDPEQNTTFTDNYLDLPYDLSNVLFITTANSIETIPQPLLDRMEVIQISSYTATEKYHIAKDHLIRKSLKEHGLTEDNLKIEDNALRAVITEYTMEAGVRGLKKQLDTLARITAEKVVIGDDKQLFVINSNDLPDLLGRKVSRHEIAQEHNVPGVVTGLAWTPVGGEILFIEATAVPGNGGITLTGKLGDVMQESAKIALSLLKSRLPVNAVPFKEKDIHVHVPSGAVPKDGPSAGIAMFTTLASLTTGIPVSGKLAMTGEVSLRGVVMPIGGLKEKLIAAHRAGITKALIPVDNKVDLKDVPDEVKETMTIVTVETIEDVLHEALGIRLPRPSTVSWLTMDDKGEYLLPSQN